MPEDDDDRPTRFVLHTEEGEIELDEETTQMLYNNADAEGMTPLEYVRASIHTQHLLLRHGLLKKD